jgi:hypothetical protein
MTPNNQQKDTYPRRDFVKKAVLYTAPLIVTLAVKPAHARNGSGERNDYHGHHGSGDGNDDHGHHGSGDGNDDHRHRR